MIKEVVIKLACVTKAAFTRRHGDARPRASRTRVKSLPGRPAVLVLVALAPLALAMGACGSDGDSDGAKSTDKLVVGSFGGSWGNAIQVGLVDQFEAETGIDVELTTTADVAKSALAVESGNKPPEDVIDLIQPATVPLVRKNLLAKIQYDEFDQANLKQIPSYLKRPYAMGWGQFAMGLCFDKRKFPDSGPQPSGWADFWDTKRFPGRRGLIDWSVQPQPELAAIAAGVSHDDLYPIDTKMVFDKMDEIRPSVPKFITEESQLQQQLIDGSVSMSSCFTHRVQSLVKGGVDTIGVDFKDGQLISEYFAVWKNAPNRENAMKFLDFILKAKPQAAWARVSNAAPVNPQAYRRIPDDIAATLATAPANREKLFVNNDDWYSASAGNSQSNQEKLLEQFRAWLDG